MADFWCAFGYFRGILGGPRDAFGDLNSMLGGSNGFQRGTRCQEHFRGYQEVSREFKTVSPDAVKGV